jgi:hypothetical protein
MAAVVNLREYDTATGTDRISETVRFQAKNTTGSLLVNPPILAPSRYTFSYEKWFRLYVASGSYVSLDNARFFWDGAFDDPNVKLAARVASAWVAPVRPADGAFPPDGFTDAAAYDSAANTLIVHPGSFILASATGAGTQNYLVLVQAWGDGADVTAAPGFPGTYLWDEGQ